MVALEQVPVWWWYETGVGGLSAWKIQERVGGEIGLVRVRWGRFGAACRREWRGRRDVRLEK